MMNDQRPKEELKEQALSRDKLFSQQLGLDEEMEEDCLDIRIPAHQVIDLME